MLPTGFNPVEQFQNAVRRILNPRVRKHFRDVSSDDDLSTDRGQVRRACFHDDKDSLLLTVGKLLLYFCLKLDELIELVALGKNSDPNELRPQYHAKATNHPKIVLYFSASKDATPGNDFAITAESSFRLMSCINYRKENQSGTVVNDTILRALASKIATEFRGYRFTKGDRLYLYTDPENGFFGSKLYALNSRDAERHFIKLCQVAGVSFNPLLLKDTGYVNRKSNTRPTSKVVGYGGKLVNEPQFRPIGQVYFRGAWADVDANKPKVLVDAMDLLRNAFVQI